MQKIADRLDIARNTLFNIRSGKASVTPSIALSLAEAFDTTPQLWLNLQANYDLWIEEHAHTHVKPILKNGQFLHIKQNIGIAKVPFSIEKLDILIPQIQILKAKLGKNLIKNEKKIFQYSLETTCRNEKSIDLCLF